MTEMMLALQQYLGDTLGIPGTIRAWEKGVALPQYLRERYRFFEVDVLGHECVLAVDEGETEQSPAIVCKQLEQIRRPHNAEVVYVRRAVTAHNRKRLIEQKVPFVVPGNQMYLPTLGIDLREHVKRLWQKRQAFSASTQALVLYLLWRDDAEVVTPSRISRRLGYSAMTMTRAFDQLQAAAIGEHNVQGRERHLFVPQSKGSLWDQVLPYMDTPVARRVFVESSTWIGHSLVAGLSALAHYTMLAEPANPTYAIAADEWRTRAKREQIIELPFPEPGACEVELWKYTPATFARAEAVDRLSLFLSMRDDPDERVQSSLNALMEGMPW